MSGLPASVTGTTAAPREESTVRNSHPCKIQNRRRTAMIRRRFCILTAAECAADGFRQFRVISYLTSATMR